MAAVYEGPDRNGHRVAIQYLLERYVDGPSVRTLFSREVYANIMPLLEGETLRSRLQRMNEHLPLLGVGLLTSDLLELLARAHAKRIVHRDIKPDNLLLRTARRSTRYRGPVLINSMGVSMDWHGPHHDAVKSITTSFSRLAFRYWSNSALVSRYLMQPPFRDDGNQFRCASAV
ncbi:hypothetical protein LZC95_30605 [Pendulispora brunnea]|uniref:Protein kinase domain-containing protein n=1 Tax=Pendulispora brunnea TaxID=2905690 RepID=A0ABZ2JWR2_9BACT